MARRRTLRNDAADAARFIAELKTTADSLLLDNLDRGDAKLMARSLQELQRAFRLLARFRNRRKVSVFGSARTDPTDELFSHAEQFGQAMAGADWMVITGAGGGIMEAAHRGAGASHSIGVNIQLPFEQSANPVVAGGENLVDLHYFFTRKLVFLKDADAVVLFPGGFGTLDEGFEVLTLIQTGKTPPIPVVLLDAPSGRYWEHWFEYVEQRLYRQRMISAEDFHLFRITHSIDEAVAELTHFYRVYHSMRFVRDRLVIRTLTPIPDDRFEMIRAEFSDILDGGDFVRGQAHFHEANEPAVAHLPRLYFRFNRRSTGRLRELINLINRPAT